MAPTRQPGPPSYSRSSTNNTSTSSTSRRFPENHHPADPDGAPSVLHPRVAVILGIDRHWHFLLVFCRALSTAPAAWWGLRCALTFMGELLIEESCVNRATASGLAVDGTIGGGSWSVERRFRVTEVFLAVLWVWLLPNSCVVGGGGCVLNS